MPLNHCLLAFFLAVTLTTAIAAKPNFVFIYADDLGYGDIACHGHPHIQTPHIDRMAAEGTDFQRFTVVNPVCSPSRVGIITGMFPSRLGVHQHFATHKSNVERNMPDWLDPKVPVLPKILKKNGYRTAHYGKWHLSGGTITDAPLPAVYGYDDAAVHTGPGRHVFDGTPYGEMTREGSAHDKHAASFLSVAATDHAVKFIRESKDQPFYINLWLHETHHLVSATDEDKKPYPDAEEPYRTYYAAVTRADRQVGRILAVLDELGLARDTLVIFSSDNGPENTHEKPGEKLYYSKGVTGGLRGRKRSLLLGGVNVPFLVRWPEVVPAGRVDESTALAGVDIFPTFLDAAGIPLPEGYQGDGENIMTAFRGDKFERTKPVFWFWQGKHTGDDWPAYAMRDGRWMFTIDEKGGQRELHDITADRAQAKNLIDAEPDRAARMSAAITEWRTTLPATIDPRLQSKATAAPAKKKSTTASGKRPKPDRAAAFKKKDLDKDDFLTLEEYLHNFPDPVEGKRRFPNFDDDGDGKLSREEFVTPNAN